MNEFDENTIGISIDDRNYSIGEIIEILKKHKKEEDSKYTECYCCGDKYLENKLFNMIHENLEEDVELKAGQVIGYQTSPFITGIQILSTCGNGKKIKLCDNCIKKLINLIHAERDDY